MQKLILIAICFVSLNLSAQGNLQFNRVISIDTTVSSGGTHLAYTVPSGKASKIEFFTVSASSTGVTRLGFKINNQPVFSRNGGSAATSPGNAPQPGIIWLQEGDQVQFYSSGGGYSINGFISAIEFNIVP